MTDSGLALLLSCCVGALTDLDLSYSSGVSEIKCLGHCVKLRRLQLANTNVHGQLASLAGCSGTALRVASVSISASLCVTSVCLTGTLTDTFWVLMVLLYISQPHPVCLTASLCVSCRSARASGSDWLCQHNGHIWFGPVHDASMALTAPVFQTTRHFTS